MPQWTESDLIKTVPENIRLEILKKSFVLLCTKEKNTHDEFSKQIDAISFLETLVNANLSNEGLTEFYKFAKMTRKDLGLPDNLFNIAEGVIVNPKKYEELNEELNKRKTL